MIMPILTRMTWNSCALVALAGLMPACGGGGEGGGSTTGSGASTNEYVTLTVQVDGDTSVQFHDQGGALYKCGDARVPNAPSQCTAQILKGFEVDIQRTLSLPVDEEARWRLKTWSIACPVIDTNKEPRGGHCRITMNASQTVLVTFERRVRVRIFQNLSDPMSIRWEVAMSLQSAGGNPLTRAGTFDCNYPSGLPVCNVDAIYDLGTTLTIKAGSGMGTPTYWKGWGGACASFGLAATCTITLAPDVDVTGSWAF